MQDANIVTVSSTRLHSENSKSTSESVIELFQRSTDLEREFLDAFEGSGTETDGVPPPPHADEVRETSTDSSFDLVSKTQDLFHLTTIKSVSSEHVATEAALANSVQPGQSIDMISNPEPSNIMAGLTSAEPSSSKPLSENPKAALLLDPTSIKADLEQNKKAVIAQRNGSIIPAGTQASERVDLDVRLPEQNSSLLSQAENQQIRAEENTGTVAKPVENLIETLSSPSASVSQPSPSAPISSFKLTASIQPSSPVIHTPALQAVAEAVILARETSKGVSGRLDPPELGRVYIDFIFETDRPVTVVIKAETQEAGIQLRDRTEPFLNLLREQGLDDVTLKFEMPDKGSSSDHTQQNFLFTPDNEENAPLLNTVTLTPRSNYMTASLNNLDLRL